MLGFETDAYTHIHKDLDEWNSIRLFDLVSKQEACKASFPHRDEREKLWDSTRQGPSALGLLSDTEVPVTGRAPRKSDATKMLPG